MFDLSGKKALVTGSTQGIGFAVAKLLSEQGATVFVNGASSQEKVENAARQIKNAIPVLVDLSKENPADETYKKTGDVDILILNASVQYRTPWDKIENEEFDRQVKINFKSTFDLIQKYAPKMIENKWGRIITVGSVQQYKPHKQMPIYAATKCAQMSLVQNLASQFAPFGVTVNNIAPGVIATPRNEKALQDENYNKQVLAGIPCGYAGTPEDMAAGFLFLCSNEGRYVTGIDLIIDGGMHL